MLDQSRAALSGVLTSVRAEGATLNSVSDKLTRSNGALDKLQQHAAATVEDLNRADAALRDVLATSRSLSAVDREIFSTSERQLRLLASEHAEEVARENAAPKISVQLMYDRGDAHRSTGMLRGAHGATASFYRRRAGSKTSLGG